MTGRKFYKTVFTIEVLSEEPLGDGYPLEDIAYALEPRRDPDVPDRHPLHGLGRDQRAGLDGGLFGSIRQSDPETLDGAAFAKALIEQGSDPEFFDLDEQGNDYDSDHGIPCRLCDSSDTESIEGGWQCRECGNITFLDNLPDL